MSSVTYEVNMGPSLFETCMSTIANVKYTDVPILLIILLQVTCFYLRKRFNCSIGHQTVLFFFCIFCISITENINNFCHQHYSSLHFSKNYFDQDCVFIFLFWAAPFSVNAILITLGFFVDLCKSIAVHRFFKNIIPDEADAKAN